ncbi:META domain-containing protein [Pseudoalteromonas fenneropenaei]|uniref:META domain-containing protein n=1 Tax=Pseudoalteromonas fenneropenaei TaxID=1737459 RepID=A0ABV7CN57_9GAMM
MKSIAVFIAFVALLTGLSGCVSTKSLSADVLKYTRWQLHTINGKPVQLPNPVSIRFIDALQVNGFAGCNRFFGEGRVDNGKLLVANLGMTRKACSDSENRVEQQLLTLLRGGVSAELDKQILRLNAKQTFEFVRVQ